KCSNPATLVLQTSNSSPPRTYVRLQTLMDLSSLRSSQRHSSNRSHVEASTTATHVRLRGLQSPTSLRPIPRRQLRIDPSASNCAHRLIRLHRLASSCT